MNGSKRRVLLALATIMLLTSTLSGCSSPDKTTTTGSDNVSATATIIPTTSATSQNATPDPTPASASAEAADTNPLFASGLDEMQLNSINMLNYLVVLTQEINESKNSRLYLEEAYSTLLNNTSPEAVDSRTLVEINYLLDTLESYRMIAVKRDRLQYIYEKNRAQALRDAMPNPLGLMSAVQSFSLSKMVASVVYMAVDSYTSYESSIAQADLQYLQDGWALDDSEATALHGIRKGTFNYMVETVRDYNLPGALSLTEQAVTDYVKWKNKSNNIQIIQFLEENVDTYRAFGPYWLTLAECYYNFGDYTKCLQAVNTYEQLQTQIFRRDYLYATVLPLAIVSAGEVLDTAQFVDVSSRYIESILANTDNDDWTLRYFAAQTCINLSSLTGDASYLANAFRIALNNVNYLLDEQKALNAEYLADIQEVKPAKDATNPEKDEIKGYNNLLKKERETALPPIHEPLLLNCDLLFSLAAEMDISAAEAGKIDGILHENGEPLFLAEPMDQMYWMTGNSGENAADGTVISFDGSQVTVPAQYVTENASINVTVSYNGEDTVFSDWDIVKVERTDKKDPSSFIATFTSETAKKHKYSADASIRIAILPKEGSQAEQLTCNYQTVAAKTFYVFDTIEFRRVE